jgi:hypothetical protein
VLGVRPRRGGKHAAVGTHNSVLRLGDESDRSYLELIAIDPDGIKPDRPRWFDLDRPSMRASLAHGPRLIHWVARCADIEAARKISPDEHGRVYPMTRGPYSWRITIPDDGHLPGEGLIPTLIQWADDRHPVDALADDRIGIVTMAGAHPEPGTIRAALCSDAANAAWHGNAIGRDSLAATRAPHPARSPARRIRRAPFARPPTNRAG